MIRGILLFLWISSCFATAVQAQFPPRFWIDVEDESRRKGIGEGLGEKRSVVVRESLSILAEHDAHLSEEGNFAWPTNLLSRFASPEYREDFQSYISKKYEIEKGLALEFLISLFSVVEEYARNGGYQNIALYRSSYRQSIPEDIEWVAERNARWYVDFFRNGNRIGFVDHPLYETFGDLHQYHLSSRLYGMERFFVVATDETGAFSLRTFRSEVLEMANNWRGVLEEHGIDSRTVDVLFARAFVEKLISSENPHPMINRVSEQILYEASENGTQYVLDVLEAEHKPELQGARIWLMGQALAYRRHFEPEFEPMSLRIVDTDVDRATESIEALALARRMARTPRFSGKSFFQDLLPKREAPSPDIFDVVEEAEVSSQPHVGQWKRWFLAQRARFLSLSNWVKDSLTNWKPTPTKRDPGEKMDKSWDVNRGIREVPSSDLVDEIPLGKNTAIPFEDSRIGRDELLRREVMHILNDPEVILALEEYSRSKPGFFSREWKQELMEFNDHRGEHEDRELYLRARRTIARIRELRR